MLISLAGATGTGKTALSLDLAEELARRGQPAEIVNADAMQLYRGMDVGTAKVPLAERRGIPHHLFDLWSVREQASVALYRDAARRAIEGIEGRGAIPILVGGSGLYREAVLGALDLAATDAAVRGRLEQQAVRLGATAMHARLAEIDAETAARIPAGNVRRVVRALEVVELTGRPYSASLPDPAVRWRPARRVIVDLPTEELAPRLERRARAMWAGGLLDEVRGLLAEGLAGSGTAAKAVGYAQAIRVLAGDLGEAQAVEETIRLTWRIVRRQRAWFVRDVDALRVRADDPAAGAAILAG